MNDEEAIIYLSNLKQIGRWSAEMILLFTYNRPNIWPIQDVGLLRAISKNYKKKYLPPERFVKNLQKKFSPYCSVATCIYGEVLIQSQYNINAHQLFDDV